jgi:hypothetical protein
MPLPERASTTTKSSHGQRRRVNRLANIADDDVIAVGVRGTKHPLSSSLLQSNESERTMKQYVGLDVSQKETSVCVVDEVGQVLPCRHAHAGMRESINLSPSKKVATVNRFCDELFMQMT